MTKLTARARLYLECVADWKAPWEVQKLLGDSPPQHVISIKTMLGRLIVRDLVEWSAANGTYRTTDAGRAALAEARGEK